MHRLVLGNPFATLVAPILLCVVAFKLLNRRRASAPRNEEDLNPGMPSPPISPTTNCYDVFLSFRGVDTRKGFADHLYYGLLQAGIHVFRGDDELCQGATMHPDLREAIKSSDILIAVISPNYASSKWCLNQLVYMMECMERLGRIVLPVFYGVDPADVRYQRGSFGEAFHYYHSKHSGEEDVAKWRQALQEVSCLSGWEATRGEAELVKVIVRKVMYELRKKFELVITDNLVGIDSPVEKIMEFVNENSDDTVYVGICGMGGVGKTTLAKVIYKMLSNQFEHRSFIADIRESCKNKGILYLQNRLISDILREEFQFYDHDKITEFISSRFENKKVLLLLDDVATFDELKALAGNRNWFAPGSRILVTTRNKSILDSEVDFRYELGEMDEEQSLVLFSRHAFRSDSPPNVFLDISRIVVSVTGGLPLSLEVIGSFLCGKELSLWKGVIQKMQNVPHRAVQEQLKISYEILDYEQKQIFLDIACFLIGSDARVASYMWDDCGFFPREGMAVLRSLSLIKIKDNHEFIMHDQLRDLGRNIVRQESYDELHRHSRLWIYVEALEVLERNEGTEKIEAIYLERQKSTRIADEGDSDYVKERGSRTFTDEQFRNLSRLRFLHMSDVNLIGDFKDIFPELRWLKWGNCSSTFEAINFHPKELVILDLSGSSISDDWQGWTSLMMAKRLKVLNLTGCRYLKSTSYLSAFQNLEILILRDCGQLEQINPCIGDHKALVSLDLRGCSCVEELPPQMGKLERLEELLLDQTMIKEIPSFIGALKNLETLSAKDCKSLLELPDSIGRLVNLRRLSLGCCHQLRRIPHSIGNLKLLTHLDLSGTGIKELHHSLENLEILILRDCGELEQIDPCIGDLKALVSLDLRGCSCVEELPPQMAKLEHLEELLLDQTMIKEIPSFIGALKNLETLSAKDCKSLLELSESIGHLVNLRRLSLGCCHQLRRIPHSIGDLKLLTHLDLSGTGITELPSSLENLQKLEVLDINNTSIKKLPDRIQRLKSSESCTSGGA